MIHRIQPRRWYQRAHYTILDDVFLGGVTAVIGETELIIMLPLLYHRLSNLGFWKPFLVIEKKTSFKSALLFKYKQIE